jgi:hypothetical protein
MKDFLKATIIIFSLIFLLVPVFVKADGCCDYGSIGQPGRCNDVPNASMCAGRYYENTRCIRGSCVNPGCCEYLGGGCTSSFGQDECQGVFHSGETCDSGQCINRSGEATTLPSPDLTNVFIPQVTIPGSEFKSGYLAPLTASGNLIARYIVAIYRYGIWLAAVLAVIMIMVGGFLWMMAGGSAERVSAAKSRIGAAILGLGIALASYLLLSGINPRLVRFDLGRLPKPAENLAYSPLDAWLGPGESVDHAGHRATNLGASGDSADIGFASRPIRFTLKRGESKEIDTNNNKIPDFRITLLDIQGQSIHIRLEVISEDINYGLGAYRQKDHIACDPITGNAYWYDTENARTDLYAVCDRGCEFGRCITPPSPSPEPVDCEAACGLRQCGPNPNPECDDVCGVCGYGKYCDSSSGECVDCTSAGTICVGNLVYDVDSCQNQTNPRRCYRGVISADGWSYYCGDDNNVWGSRMVRRGVGCVEGSCLEEETKEKALFQVCDYGCETGVCNSAPPPPPSPICPDGTCDLAAGENSTNCPADCLPAPPPDTNTNTDTSAPPPTPVQSCNQCGEGMGYCDRDECLDISEGCYFIDTGLPGFGGACQPCSEASACTDYGTDETSCTSDVCHFGSCNFEGGQCQEASPPPETCEFYGASWGAARVTEGTAVTLTVNGSAGCSSREVNFEIYEDDILDDDYITTITDTYNSTTWIAEYRADLGGPEYYFRAILVEDPTVLVESENLEVTRAEVPPPPPPDNGNENANVPPPSTCTDTCGSLGYECGQQIICGEPQNCGSCPEGEECQAGQCVAVAPPPTAECGNGVRESGESCDNGPSNGVACVANYNDFCNYCSSECQVINVYGPRCGDGNCDESYGESCSSCESDCGACPPTQVCGNGIVEGTEQCDAGSNNGTGCDAGYNETCDYCSTACMVITITGSYCGNLICDAGYEDCSSCEDDCGSCGPPAVPVCGNGDLEAGESCDFGSQNGNVCTPSYDDFCNYCTSECTIELIMGPTCSDGTCQSEYGEACSTCPADCGECLPPPPECGNGIVEGTEQCDAGSNNGNPCDPGYNGSCTYCSSSCTTVILNGPRCGDDSCDAGYEDCNNCATDCGACPSTNTNASPGSSGTGIDVGSYPGTGPGIGQTPPEAGDYYR